MHAKHSYIRDRMQSVFEQMIEYFMIQVACEN